MGVAERLYFEHGGRQVLAQSREGDAKGHGRGETWPTGSVEDLAPFRDFGGRAVDPVTNVFDANHGRDALERLFADSCVELMTLNGTASTLFTAGSRGPRPVVKVYSKAHNALIREWPVCALIYRLIDEATTDVSPTGEPIVTALAKVLGWHSTDQDTGSD